MPAEGSGYPIYPHRGSAEWVQIHLAVGVSCRRHLLSRKASEALGDTLVLAYARRGVYVGQVDAAYGYVRLIVSTPPCKRLAALMRCTRGVAGRFLRRNPVLAGQKVRQLDVWTEPPRAAVRAARGGPHISGAFCALL